MTTRDDTPSPSTATRSTSRRGFLTLAGVAGVGAAGAALAACGSDKKATTAATAVPASTEAPASTTTTSAPRKNVDLETAGAAAGIELVAVQAYTAAATAAGKGALGAVPPAVGEFVTTALAHHQAALDKWNGLLKAAGKPAITEPNVKLKATADAALAKATDVASVAALALSLEQIAAATYQKAIPLLTAKEAITLAGSIQVVDAQHVAVLLFVTGKYPVPEVFGLTDQAAI